ncbi:MAG: DUF1236 domain-containing protein [Hyphomicrobiales bacterium]|nr:DUF1236 domain-containing protein [Hyphomicrobiales bacterium]
MRIMKNQMAAVALLAALAVPSAAVAQQAYATIDLNMRAGPGPQFPIVSVIRAEEGVTIYGCTESGSWCDVSWGQERGWAYAEYLAFDVAGSPAVVTQVAPDSAPSVVTYQTTTYWDEHYRDRPFYSERQRYVAVSNGSSGAAVGAAGGAVTGAVVGGPVGAVIGGVAGAAIGASIDPPARVESYVVNEPVEPVLLEGEVVLGARLPQVVALQPIPDYQYQYAIVNGQRVLVDPRTRTVVHIYR